MDAVVFHSSQFPARSTICPLGLRGRLCAYQGADAQEHGDPASKVVGDGAETHRADQEAKHVGRLAQGLQMATVTNQVPLQRIQRVRLCVVKRHGLWWVL